jgi:hypothetical protein
LISIRFIYAFLARYFLLKAGARNAVGVSPLDTASRLALGASQSMCAAAEVADRAWHAPSASISSATTPRQTAGALLVAVP